MFLLNGLKLTSTGEAGILTGASPAITAILAILLLREPVNFRKLMGIAGTVTGISLIQGFFSSGTAFSIKHFWGNILILCAASCESVFNIFSRVFAVKKTVHNSSRLEPTVQTLIVTAIAMVLCLVPAMFEQPMQRLHEIGPTEWLALLWYGIFVTALAFIFWYSGIKRCGALTAAAFSGIMPFTSMLLSVVVLGESVVQRQWIGGTLIILGMVLIGSGSAARTIHTPQATQ
jgi:drug/metabolite transporter (DMT)-like permease